MKANELRIGNYVHVDGKLTVVESIDNEGINSDIDYGEYGGINYVGRFPDSLWTNHDKVTGIPLAEEWLVKFGLEDFDNISILFIVKRGDIWQLEDFENTCIVKLEFVHQLQNLYFALTGEELVVR